MRWHLAHARAEFERVFGHAPRGCWPSEGAISDAAVRAIEAEGVTREGLAKIGETLVGLATRTELFPIEQFPVRKLVQAALSHEGGAWS